MESEERVLSRSKLASIEAIIRKINDEATDLWVPVTEPSFTKRLADALQRNFDFISRKDSGDETIIKHNKRPLMKQAVAYSKMNRPGIGSVVKPIQTECSSIYVTGLPLDISEEELDILFSSQGKLKKVKLYCDKEGKKKGDALVTYIKADSVPMACRQFDKLDIGDGFAISVTPADFNKNGNDSDKTKKDNLNSSCFGHAANSLLSTVQDFSYRPMVTAPRELPRDCQNDLYSVVILNEAYDPIAGRLAVLSGKADEFFQELEMEIMLECCKFGKILRVLSPESEEWEGSVAVTFEEDNAAEVCAASLSNRWFGGRQIESELMLPRSKSSILRQSSCSGIQSEIVEEQDGILEGMRARVPVVSDEPLLEPHDAAGTYQAEDVEDFLNSLL